MTCPLSVLAYFYKLFMIAYKNSL